MAAGITQTEDDAAHRPFRAWALQHDLISLLGGSADWRVRPAELGLDTDQSEDPVAAFNGQGYLREALALSPRLALRTRTSLMLWGAALVTDAANQVSPVGFRMPTGAFWITVGLVVAALIFTALVYPRLAGTNFMAVEQSVLTYASLVIFYQCSVTGGTNSPYLFWFILTAFYAAYLMPRSQAIANVAEFSLLAVATLLLNETNATDSTLLLLTSLVAVMWVAAISLIMQRRTENALERAVKFLALADPLTSVANLRSFEQFLEELSRRDGQRFAVVMADMNGLKGANAVFGHETGDGMVVRLARLMLGASGSRDQVARIGGDEFAVVLPGGREGDLIRWRKEFERAVERHNSAVRGRLPQISVSIGGALYPEDGVTAADLLDTADRRMFEEKTPAVSPPYEIGGLTTADAGHRFRAARFEDAPRRAVDVNERMKFAALNWFTISALVLAIAHAETPFSIPVAAAICGAYGVFWGLITEYCRRSGPSRGYARAIDLATLCWALPVGWATGGASSPMQIGLLLPVAFYAQTLARGQAFPRIGILLASYAITFWGFGHHGPVEETRFVTIVAGMLLIIAVMQYSGGLQDKSLRVIRESATRDRLTELPNVYALRADLDDALLRHQKDQASPIPALVVLDLDNFRRANALAGHRGGDDVLRGVASRLSEVAGSSRVYRVDGDEFALIVLGLSGRALTTFAGRCAAAVEHDEMIGGSLIPIRGSVGSAAWTAGRTGNELMEHAEEALRRDKADRRGTEPPPSSVLL
ncbi:MAG: GGDEF domain-containing protein [Thermoleophilaceae bacterium]|nr:GGDEF domain-containing protein [Thermoleophilaceae bacterium]